MARSQWLLAREAAQTVAVRSTITYRPAFAAPIHCMANVDGDPFLHQPEPGVPPVQQHVDHTKSSSPPPAHPTLPPPTYWPAALAFAITLIAWSLITSPLIFVVGVLFLFLAIGGWIGDLLNEH